MSRQATQKKSGSAFAEAVRNEALRYRPAAVEDVDIEPTDAVNVEREELQARLKEAEARVASLEPLVADPDVAIILADRKKKRDDIRFELHAARPLKTQLKAAEEARDKARRLHAALTEEMDNIRLIVKAKQEEIDQAVLAVSKQCAIVEDVQRRMVGAAVPQAHARARTHSHTHGPAARACAVFCGRSWFCHCVWPPSTMLGRRCLCWN